MFQKMINKSIDDPSSLSDIDMMILRMTRISDGTSSSDSSSTRELFDDPANYFSPLTLATLLSVIVIFLKVTQIFMDSRNKSFSFVRPAFLVNSGLCFGINGCGALLVLAATEGGKHLFQCIDKTSLSMSTIVTRYLLFMYLSTLIYDLALLILPILNKQQVTNWTIIQHILWITLGWASLKYQPSGFIVMVPVLHCVNRILYYMLTVMANASPELQPDRKWSNRLEKATFALLFLMFAHQSYFYYNFTSLSQTTGGTSPCGPSWVRTLVTLVVGLQTLTAAVKVNSSKILMPMNSHAKGH